MQEAYRTQMYPSNIRFIQSDVGQNINGRDMLDVFKQLVRREIRADDMGVIEVTPYEGLHYAFDGNRRLLLFKVRAHMYVQKIYSNPSMWRKCTKKHRFSRPACALKGGGGGGIKRALRMPMYFCHGDVTIFACSVCEECVGPKSGNVCVCMYLTVVIIYLLAAAKES